MDQTFKDTKMTLKPLNVQIIETQIKNDKMVFFCLQILSDSTLSEGSKHIETTFTPSLLITP